MSISVELERLLAYSDSERVKWRDWIVARPERMSTPFQPGGRFPTVGAILDHIFLVERRHLSRLSGATPPDSSGVAEGDWSALFEYGDLVRADFRRYLTSVAEPQASETITFTVATGPMTASKRGLLFHVLMHEARHLAQVAYAARLAGDEPPGRHDTLYFPELA